VGLCIAILVIVNNYLWYGSYWYYGSATVVYNRCYMQTSSSQGE